MIRTLARMCVLVLALAPAGARAGEPCRRAVVIRDGKAFAPETVRAPGFDPKTAPTAPWCDGDLLPASEVLRLLLVDDTLALRGTEIANERDLHKIDADEAAELLAVSEAARRACETQHAPPPARAPRWYESPWVGFGAGVVLTGALAITLAVTL